MGDPRSANRNPRNAKQSSGRTLPKTLSADEIVALMAAPNLDAWTGLRDRCILELMYRAGLRVSEACGLHLRDVDWNEGELHVRPDVAKGGIEAHLYLDGTSLELLKRWKVVRKKYAAGKPWLFTTTRGTPVRRQEVWAMMQRRARRGGIEKHVHPHMLRHTFATDLLRSGEFTLREVQELLRHRDVRSTQIYTGVYDADLKRKIRARR